MNLKSKIREVQDWPKAGINFKDITTLLQDKEAFKETIDQLTDLFKGDGSTGSPHGTIDKVVGIDARGFLLAAPVAYKIGAGLSICRKPGKLPYCTIEKEYELEYASNILQMHNDAIGLNERVLLVDDLIATGGTAIAACDLIEKLGGIVVGIAAVIDLPFLDGSKKLKEKGYEVKTLIEYQSE